MGISLTFAVPAQALRNLPVHLIHGQAMPAQPAVAAIAHKGQDGIFPRDGFQHELQVEQVAVGYGQDCKRTGGAVSSLHMGGPSRGGPLI